MFSTEDSYVSTEEPCYLTKTTGHFFLTSPSFYNNREKKIFWNMSEFNCLKKTNNKKEIHMTQLYQIMVEATF